MKWKWRGLGRKCSFKGAESKKLILADVCCVNAHVTAHAFPELKQQQQKKS